jgi:hypothetical protein
MLRVLLAVVLAALAVNITIARADEPFYKGKLLTLLINFAIGGPADVAMRIIGFVPDRQASPGVQQSVRPVWSTPPGVRGFLNSYIKAANK